MERWPDGTAKSMNNGFTANLDGEQSSFVGCNGFRPASKGGTKSRSQVASKTRESVEAAGKNIGTIVGLSKKTDVIAPYPSKLRVRG